MGYINNSQQFPLKFPVNWKNSLATPVVSDTTNERDLSEHMDWRAKFLPLPKVLRPLR